MAEFSCFLCPSVHRIHGYSQKHLCQIDLKSLAGVLFYNKMVKIECMSKVLNEVNSIINDILI